MQMLISNSIGKNKIENYTPSSASNLFMRSDGFKKVVKGFSATKIKAPEQLTHSKIHTSSGFRRLTKQYKLQPDFDLKVELQQNKNTHGVNYNRTMTANKDFGKRNTLFLGQGLSNYSIDKKTVQFLRLQQEQQQCFRNICKTLNIN